MDPSVQSYLRSLPAATRRVASALRRAVRKAVPHAEESVLWNGLSYHRPEIGGRVKGAVCQIVARRDEVRLEFIHGVMLDDPENLLQGSRLAKRFVTIVSAEDAERIALTQLIRAAADIRWD